MDNERRQRRQEQTLDLLHAWASLGVVVRLLLSIAIIGGSIVLAREIVMFAARLVN